MKQKHQITSYTLILINLSALRTLLEKAGFCRAGRPATEEELHIVYTYSVLLRTIIQTYAQVQQYMTQLEHNQFACKQLNREVTIALEHNTSNEDAITDQEQLHILADLQQDIKQRLVTDQQHQTTLQQTLDHIIDAAKKMIAELQQKQITHWIPELKKTMGVQHPKKSIAAQLNTLAESLNPETVRHALDAEQIQIPADRNYWPLMAALLRGPQPKPAQQKKEASQTTASTTPKEPTPEQSPEVTTTPRPAPTPPKADTAQSKDPIQQAWEDAQLKASEGIQAIVTQDPLQDIINALKEASVNRLEDRFKAAEDMSSGPSAAAAA